MPQATQNSPEVEPLSETAAAPPVSVPPPAAAPESSATIQARDTRNYRTALAISLALLGFVLLGGLLYLF